MKKIQKQIFGCFGLGVVAAMTVTAAFIPLPEASAATNVTDTIHIRVVGGTPEVNINVAGGDDITTNPAVTVNVDYDNIDKLEFKLTYKNADGTVTTYDPLIDDIDLDFEAGTFSDTINLSDSKFNIGGCDGYGEYTITVTGVGYDGVPDEKTVTFRYAPFDADAYQDTTTGMINVEATNINTDNVKEIDVYVNGEKVGTMSPDGKFTYIPTDTTTAADYEIQLVAKDANGKVIYRTGDGELVVHFDPALVPDTGVPDTGGLFRNLNISREDYLVTGLIVFFIIGVVGFGVVARGRRSNRLNKTNKRR